MKQVKMTFSESQWRLIKRYSDATLPKDAALVRALIAAYFEQQGIPWPDDLTPLGGHRRGGRRPLSP